MGGLVSPARVTPILGYYTRHGVELALERYGFLQALRSLGFRRLRVDGDSSDIQRQILRIHGRKPGFDGAGEMLLVELVVGRRPLTAPEPLEQIEVLYVEWLLLQDPTRGFDGDRPKLPGQEHPGLGLSGHMLELLRQVCVRLGLDGIASRPANYHNALVAAREFRHLYPEAEGRFRAIRRAIGRRTMLEATRAVDRGELRTGAGETQTWIPGVQLAPGSERCVRYFESKEFSEASNLAYEEWRAKKLQLTDEPSPRNA